MDASEDNPLFDGLPLLHDLPDLTGASVLVRVDFNVPLRARSQGSAVVTDDFRIRAALPTFEYLSARGARVTACTHLGRPSGAPDPRWDLAPVREVLARLAPQVELGENLRFDPGEALDDPDFVEKLVKGHDAYVNDAFGVSHRRHASVMGPPARLPSAAGLLVQRELGGLGRLLGAAARPFVAVVGGAKVADKLGVLRALLHRADALVVGGGMAFTFLAASGQPVGGSLVDHDHLGDCAKLLAAGRPILLPTDIVALEPGAAFGAGCTDGEVRTWRDGLPQGWQGLDIGPDSIKVFGEEIRAAGTVLWNGPMGVFEDTRFVAGTAGVARAVAECPGYTVVGGGDSAAAVDELGLGDRIDFVSTGGGAALELIEHGDLPGLAALRGAPNAPAPGRRSGRGASPERPGR